MKTIEQESREYLNGLKDQISEMNPYEQTVNKSVLILGQVILEIINRYDQQAFDALKEMVEDLFQQAEDILGKGPRHIQ